MIKSDYILEVKNICKTFKTEGKENKAVDHVSFNVKKGETLAIVGESGCGKSTTGRMLLRLLEPDSGEILFKGKNLCDLNKRDMRRIRPEIQIVFQDPYGALNPRMKVRELLEEAILSNPSTMKSQVTTLCHELIESVEMKIEDLEKYPHEFSGGQRQRLVIARAIATKPDIIVCDEPVSALDLLVQAQILNLLKDLQKKLHLSYVFISHDLSVVKHMSDRIAIMHTGKIVEMGTKNEIFQSPSQHYTKMLLESILPIK
jgi:ABC-type oligopeptide transport system ATPase subunit